MNFSSGPAVFEVMLHRDNTLYVLALTPWKQAQLL